MTLLFGWCRWCWIVWASRSAAARRKAAWEETERKVLTLAMAPAGASSAPLEVAAKTDLSLDEAKRYLDRLADQGHVDLTPSDQGWSTASPAPAPHCHRLDPHPQAHRGGSAAARQ